MAAKGFDGDLEELLRVREGFHLAGVDPGSTPGYRGGKSGGEALLAEQDLVLAELQERLYAAGRDGDAPSLLLILQAMDTAGKGGIVSHVVGGVDVQGVKLKAFKAPTDEEKAHDFLWRVERELPEAGMLGVFDRSHYEDVLIHRVHGWADAAEIERRYGAIRDFEERLASGGTRLVKVMLNISKDEQKERLLARLDDPIKRWKYNPGDVDERLLWDEYMDAYQRVFEETATESAPWYVVPANKKWYARIAVQQLLISALGDIAPDWPEPTYGVEHERARVAAS
ncbi:PPK2 family polyphosphate kinase [Sinomonas mesophila]|uniref:PPK2 family polyphosphate kinase n=1 Tax=Sinomonas mesophila TaxID=1531955 RepID=UPI000987220A|nr:PPK2 family polyphosphate kinase [Sinomonas mesophila]